MQRFHFICFQYWPLSGRAQTKNSNESTEKFVLLNNEIIDSKENFSANFDLFFRLSTVLRRRNLLASYGRIKRLNPFFIIVRLPRQYQETNWYLLKIIQESRDIVEYNIAKIVGNRLFSNSATTTLRKEHIHGKSGTWPTHLKNQSYEHISKTYTMVAPLGETGRRSSSLMRRQTPSRSCPVKSPHRENSPTFSGKLSHTYAFKQY